MKNIEKAQLGILLWPTKMIQDSDNNDHFEKTIGRHKIEPFRHCNGFGNAVGPGQRRGETIFDVAIFP